MEIFRYNKQVLPKQRGKRFAFDLDPSGQSITAGAQNRKEKGERDDFGDVARLANENPCKE